MQNTLVREFEGNPDVVTFVFDQGGAAGETREWLEVFWENYYLRGGVVFDETGEIGALYGQPNTGLPFGRGFIIDRDGRVSLPYFGHQPQMAIQAIHALLGSSDLSDPPGAVAAASLGWAYPNPFRNATRLRFDLPPALTAKILVFDALGRRIRALSGSGGVTGSGIVSWDGRDEAGKRVPAGVYFLSLEGGSPGSPVRLVRIPE